MFATTVRRLLGVRLCCCLVLHQPNHSVSKLQHFSQSDIISENYFTNCLMLTRKRILSPRVWDAHGGRLYTCWSVDSQPTVHILECWQSTDSTCTGVLTVNRQYMYWSDSQPTVHVLCWQPTDSTCTGVLTVNRQYMYYVDSQLIVHVLECWQSTGSTCTGVTVNWQYRAKDKWLPCVHVFDCMWLLVPECWQSTLQSCAVIISCWRGWEMSQQL